MADDDDDEVANVDESLQTPTSQSHRIDEGLGTEVVEDELPNREQEAAVSEGEAAEIVEAVVDGVESDGFEFGGSEGVGGGGVGIEGVEDEKGEETEVVEVNIGEGGDDESEDVKGKVGVKLESGAASEGYRLKAAFGDMEKIHESSKVEEGGKDNVAGKSDVSGMVVEECHTKDVVEEKGEEFVKNLAAEQCTMMTACDDMEQIDHFGEKVKEDDGEENAAAGSDFIGKGVEDCHKNAAVEEKMKEEKNLAAEQSVAVTAIGDTAQIDESRDTLKKEEVIDDNMAGNTHLISMVTEDSHMDDAIVEEKGEEFEKNVALEQCAVVTTTGGMDQIVDSRNKSKEDGGREENVAGDSEKNIVEVTRDHIDKSGNVEARDGDEEMGTEEENTNNQEKLEEGLSAAPDVEFSLHRVMLEPTTGDGDEEMRSVEEKIDNKEKLEEDLSAIPDVELSLHKVVLEPTTGDGDEGMGSEEENSDNKEMLEEKLSAAPDLEFSLQEVVLEPTTVVGDEEMGSEVGNKENNEKLEEDLLTSTDVEYSLHNIVLETAAGDGEEMGLEVENKEKKGNLEEDLSTAPDVEFSLHNVVPETAAGDGDEEMGSEEDNSVNKEKLDKDLSAASDVDLSLHNVELEPTAGEEDEEFVDGEEPPRADAIESHIEMPDSEKGNIKPKRGRKPSKVVLIKKTEEDVCFICFDGGDLVVCDRR